MHEINFHIERYRGTRFFGLYCNGNLLCVTVYKKGAIAVRDTMQALLDANEEAQARIAELLEVQAAKPRQSSHSSNRGKRTGHV